VAFNHFFQHIHTDASPEQSAFSSLDIIHQPAANQPVNHERLEQLNRHGQTTLVDM